MKRLATFAVIVAALFCAGAVVGAEAPKKDIPKTIQLKVYPKKPVTFGHQEHARRIGKCQFCHHNPDSDKCSDCHGSKREDKTPSFREAMHYKCKNCHMRDGKKVKGMCKECHPNIGSGKS